MCSGPHGFSCLVCWLAAVTALPSPLTAQSAPETFNLRLVNFETAETLPAGILSLSVGTHQTVDSDAGTGSQLYYGALDYAVTDRIQLGFSAQVIEDRLEKPVLGTRFATRFQTYGASLKYRVLDATNTQASLLGSVELLEFRTGLYGTDVTSADHVIGSLHLPVTYRASPTVQLHLTPGLSVFPDRINGIPYYGTIASIGAGLTWTPNYRWQGYAQVSAPLSGGNTFNTNREIIKVPVVTAGVRYAVSPKVSLEGYVTNGLGTSPATSILAFYPDGDSPLFGAVIRYTPNRSLAETYRPTPALATEQRRSPPKLDGFTVASAHVLDKGTLSLSASGGSFGNYAISAAFGVEPDFQIEGAIEDYSDDGSLSWNEDPTPDSARWMAGGRVRFLDQAYGDPLSLSLRVLGGRDLEEFDVGVLYVAAPSQLPSGSTDHAQRRTKIHRLWRHAVVWSWAWGAIRGVWQFPLDRRSHTRLGWAQRRLGDGCAL